MPPLIFLAIIGVAGFAGYKLLSTLVHQAAHPPRRDGDARTPAAPTRDLGKLEWDEVAGVYKPRGERESS